MTAPAQQVPDHLLLFDGVCNLCNGTVRFVIRHDQKQLFRFAPLQSAAAQAILRNHGLDTTRLTSLVYFRKGRVLVRSSAALHVARDLGGAWRIAFAFILVPRWMRDAFYNLVARKRYRWFGRQDHCMVPSRKLRGRFLA